MDTVLVHLVKYNIQGVIQTAWGVNIPNCFVLKDAILDLSGADLPDEIRDVLVVVDLRYIHGPFRYFTPANELMTVEKAIVMEVTPLAGRR
jgi:hypothetical protein